MYSIIPIMSFVMAINGPVAMAGSIFSFFQCHRDQCAEDGGEHHNGKQADGYGISNRSRRTEPDKVVGIYQQGDDGSID